MVLGAAVFFVVERGRHDIAFFIDVFVMTGTLGAMLRICLKDQELASVPP